MDDLPHAGSPSGPAQPAGGGLLRRSAGLQHRTTAQRRRRVETEASNSDAEDEAAIDALHDHAGEVQPKRHWVDQFYAGVGDVKNRCRSDKEILSVCSWQLAHASTCGTLATMHSSPDVLLAIVCSGVCATNSVQ